MAAIIDTVVNLAVNVGTRVVAPDSLALADASETTFSLKAKRAARAVRPGDIILVQTPGRFFSFWRNATGNPYDHVAMVVSKGQVLHVSPPVIRLLPIARLMAKHRAPLVLRPRLTRAEVARVVASVEQIVGERYAAERSAGLIGRLLLANQLRVHATAMQAIPPLSSCGRWICTDAVFSALFQHSLEFRNAALSCRPKLDASLHGAASMSDFLFLHRKYPSLFSVVKLPELDTGSVASRSGPDTSWLERLRRRVRDTASERAARMPTLEDASAALASVSQRGRRRVNQLRSVGAALKWLAWLLVAPVSVGVRVLNSLTRASVLPPQIAAPLYGILIAVALGQSVIAYRLVRRLLFGVTTAVAVAGKAGAAAASVPPLLLRAKL